MGRRLVSNAKVESHERASSEWTLQKGRKLDGGTHGGKRGRGAGTGEDAAMMRIDVI